MAPSGRPPDYELAEIQSMWTQLAAMQRQGSLKEQSPAYRALMRKIRAKVNARTKIRGDEMIIATEKAPNFKG